jgi:hypothetical protein
MDEPDQLQTPVAFIIFNRPDTTARVFAEIAKARPRKLLVIADGPRPHKAGEAERCAQTRAIIDGVDWECEVLRNFSNTNLGCRSRVASGIDWVFEQVPEAIILEDDCLPDPSFFRFCEEMLDRYRDDTRIAMISGDNFLFNELDVEGSYYFSRYCHIWGWASWRRAWRFYDRSASIWPQFQRQKCLKAIAHSLSEEMYWTAAFDGVQRGEIDTWDYQWGLACWTENMLSIMPTQNLISNIGFGLDATHTSRKSRYAEMMTTALEFPLQHPRMMVPNRAADEYTARYMFSGSAVRRFVKFLRNKLTRGRR